MYYYCKIICESARITKCWQHKAEGFEINWVIKKMVENVVQRTSFVEQWTSASWPAGSRILTFYLGQCHDYIDIFSWQLMLKKLSKAGGPVVSSDCLIRLFVILSSSSQGKVLLVTSYQPGQGRVGKKVVLNWLSVSLDNEVSYSAPCWSWRRAKTSFISTDDY